MKKIGTIIKKFRNEKGLSQLQLGLAIGNDSSYIARIEGGKCEPSIGTVIKIAYALEVQPLEIFTEFFKEENILE